MKIYKIYNKQTGLFSDGGSNYTFSKTGKIYKELRMVKAHYNMLYRKLAKSLMLEFPNDNRDWLIINIHDMSLDDLIYLKNNVKFATAKLIDYFYNTEIIEYDLIINKSYKADINIINSQLKIDYHKQNKNSAIV